MCHHLLACYLVVTSAVAWADDKKDNKKDDPPKNLYPLTKGAKWEYSANLNGVESVFENEVTEVSEPKKGERQLATVITKTGKLKIPQVLSSDGKGVYLHDDVVNLFDPPLIIVQHGEKLGRKWSRKAKFAGEEVTWEFEQKDQEKVKVPAGEFAAVVVVQTAKDGKGEVRCVITTWFTEEVGVVKSTMDSPAYDKNPGSVSELKKYTPAK